MNQTIYMLYDPVSEKALGCCFSYDCAVAHVAELKFKNKGLEVQIEEVEYCTCKPLPELMVKYDYQWSATDEKVKAKGANIPDEGLYSPTEWNNLDYVKNGPYIEFEDIVENFRQTPYERLLKFSNAATTNTTTNTKQNKRVAITPNHGKIELEEGLNNMDCYFLEKYDGYNVPMTFGPYSSFDSAMANKLKLLIDDPKMYTELAVQSIVVVPTADGNGFAEGDDLALQICYTYEEGDEVTIENLDKKYPGVKHDLPEEGRWYSASEWENLNCVDSEYGFFPVCEMVDYCMEDGYTPEVQKMLRIVKGGAETKEPEVIKSKVKSIPFRAKQGKLELEESLFLNSK